MDSWDEVHGLMFRCVRWGEGGRMVSWDELRDLNVQVRAVGNGRVDS